MKLTMVKKQIEKIYIQQIDSVCLYGGSSVFGWGGGGRKTQIEQAMFQKKGEIRLKVLKIE